MPNYRQRNKKKNHKKHNNNNNNNKNKNNKNKNQQEQARTEENEHKDQNVQNLTATSTESTKLQDDHAAEYQQQEVGKFSNTPTFDCGNKDHVEIVDVLSDSSENAKDDDRSNECTDQCKYDTVSNENARKNTQLVEDNMGTKHTKEANKTTRIEHEEVQIDTDHNEHENDLTTNTQQPQQQQQQQQQQHQLKLIIHRLVPENVEQAKVIIHPIAVEEEPEDDIDIIQDEYEEIVDAERYQVQSPTSNDDETIEKVTDEQLTGVQIVEVQASNRNEEQIECLQIQEMSNDEYKAQPTAKTDDYKLKRAQKRVALESHFLPQLLSPRYLDSILEENSDLSDCSERALFLRSLSASSAETDSAHFEKTTKRANANFPRSQLDFSKPHKSGGTLPNTLPTLPGPISEEPVAMMVEAKLIEQLPESAEESCSTLTFKHLEPQLEDAEVIFIHSSTSSSTSDLMELDETSENVNIERETIDLDTDASEIIVKPDQNERETTPVNSSIAITTIASANIEKNEECGSSNDHLNSDEQYSQCSSETIVENNSSETADYKSSANSTADDSSVLSLASLSDNSTVDASVEDSSSAEAFARLEETCREIMDNVREIVNANSETVFATTKTANNLTNGLSYGLPPYIENASTNGKHKSPSPPPIPPPPQLISLNKYEQPSVSNKPILTTPLERQASYESHCSSSTNQSQCTAINVAVNSPPYRDFQVSTVDGVVCLPNGESSNENENENKNKNEFTQQENMKIVKEIINSEINTDLSVLKQNNVDSIKKLRQLCTQKLASLPYGEQVLFELANLAQNIGKMPLRGQAETQSNLKQLQMLLTQQQNMKERREELYPQEMQQQQQQKQVRFPQEIELKEEQQVQQEQLRSNSRQEIEQKVLLEDINDDDDDDDNNDSSKKLQLFELKCEISDKNMNELRKNMTDSPPPLPPPPVPMKSVETVAKAQQQQQQNSRIIPIVFEKNDATTRNVNEQKQQSTTKTTFTLSNEDDSSIRLKQYEQQQKQKADEEEEKYKLYANKNASSKTSSVENNSRQAAFSGIIEKNFEQKQVNSSEQEVKKQSSSFIKENHNTINKLQQHQDMQSMESELARMFPSLGNDNIFDNNKKRYSNIENTSFPISSNMAKRYSNIETTSYEAQKRIENGQVVFDSEKKQHEQQKEGADKLDNVDTMRSAFDLGEKLQLPTNKTNEDEKLFKDFNELSQQLQKELETGRKEREEREKSASLFDISRTHMKEQWDQLRKERHEHMLELEREIDRSMKSRQAKRSVSCEPHQQAQQSAKVHEIPIKVQNSEQVHTIPIRIQNTEHVHEIPIKIESTFEHDSNSPFRRTESLFNLTPSSPLAEPHRRPRTASSNYELQQQQQLYSDEWSQYNSDMDTNEYMSRPTSRQRMLSPRPREIRAPRLTSSQNDICSTPTFDPFNAYNVPRTQRTNSSSLYSLYERESSNSKQQSSASNCYSVLQRDPNPTYISTTSRRGVSPAPVQPQATPQVVNRRASLPHEIHEQQLKYINNKEEELRMEFERLQNERRRLMQELQREKEIPATPQQPPVPPRVRERPLPRVAPRLPTLSEDEVMRQQMAEEWLSKVAEREERRLQKVIKISKMHEESGHHSVSESQHEHLVKPDISQEFLDRVKERRHKLHMPADSDWESGAESQPANAQAREEPVPEIKIVSGRTLADTQQLPQHLKEFARYSNDYTEQLANGGKQHVHETEEKRQEATANSSSSATKKSTIATTIKIARQPPVPGECKNIADETADTTKITTTTSTSAATTSLALKNNNDSYTNNSFDSSSTSSTTNTSNTETGSILGVALALGMGALAAWVRLR